MLRNELLWCTCGVGRLRARALQGVVRVLNGLCAYKQLSVR